MKEETKQWTWSNGWILMSVYLAQLDEVTTLAGIIAAADATNHAIPTPIELSHAFAKLVNAGVVVVNNDNYKINSKYLDEIEKAYKTKGGLFESANKGKKWLNASGLTPNGKPKLTITNEQVTKAYNAYTSKVRK
jgi:hypothetical protein